MFLPALRRHGTRRTTIAVAAAYALALQAILLGLAFGVHAASAEPGFALCNPDRADPAAPGHPAAAHVALCCLAGCGHAPTPLAAAQPPAGPAEANGRILHGRPPVRFDVAGIAPRPVGARAPPVAA